MLAKFVILLSMISMASACARTKYAVTYETLSNETAENFRKAIHGPYQNKDWEKTSSNEGSKFELSIGQTKDEFEGLLRAHGFQRVGGTAMGLPYSCVDDPCRCSESKIVNYARSVDIEKSFETIALQYGPKTFDGICRPGLFGISTLDIFENNNAKN